VAQWRAGLDLVRQRLGQVLGELSDDEARGDRVAGDAPRRDFAGRGR
jgi:hypothetical protein